MKWIYGKQDFNTLERAQENCYLLTNGLGGFSSMTMAGSVTRNDHGLFMACIKAPNQRYNMVHRLSEKLLIGGSGDLREYILSSQEFASMEKEQGYEYLTSFTYEDTPVWKFLAAGVEIRKEAAMKQEANTVALRYEVFNRGRKEAVFTITPFFQFTPKGSDLEKDQEIKRTGTRLFSNGLVLHFRTNGEILLLPEREEIYYYSYDDRDGRRSAGHARANHEISITIGAGKRAALELIYEMEPGSESAEEIIAAFKGQRKELIKTAAIKSPIGNVLVKSAFQFLSRRESTKGATILAGFPFFEDWGRDTMIALPGICIATGWYERAKEILRTFAVNERKGLMPNLFPEGGREPMYNTVDASLLFINCVYLYHEATGDHEFVKEMYPVMVSIVENYRKGTEYGIHMDEDGLIKAGEGLFQLTWMDVRIDGILPTKRHGKPVEINAYWYNALCVMEHFNNLTGKTSDEYKALIKQVKTSFVEKFWMEEKGCLKDLVSGGPEDEQIRCNQIWALSMPFTMLDRKKEQEVVEIVFEKLYTPYGLRTLEKEDPDFHPTYGGPVKERDMAYHQGTVWPFPLGAYYLAYLKVKNYSKEAKETVRAQLEVLESALREGCIGQLPEIYDGSNPTSSKGCFAQAWSVGELLRVYKKLEEEK